MMGIHRYLVDSRHKGPVMRKVPDVFTSSRYRHFPLFQDHPFMPQADEGKEQQRRIEESLSDSKTAWQNILEDFINKEERESVDRLVTLELVANRLREEDARRERKPSRRHTLANSWRRACQESYDCLQNLFSLK